MTSLSRTCTSLALLLALGAGARGVGAQGLVDPPSVALEGIPFALSVEGGVVSPTEWSVRDADGTELAGGFVQPGDTVSAEVTLTDAAQLPLVVTLDDEVVELAPTLVSPIFSLLPPLVAIVMALLFREVVTALFAGVWLGALAVAGFNPLAATARTIDTFMVPELGDVAGGHTAIVAFSLLLGGMVGLIARNGGTMGIVEAVAPFASSQRRGRLATWAAGLAIFFDDYANTLIVGNTMRPITDRLKISREKLAYIVDSTAAPVAALVPISTWVGYEISLIGDGLRIAAEQTGDGSLLTLSPFTVFIQTIPFLFYPLLALLFVLLTAATGRDFGPMADAELRAGSGGGLHRPGAVLATDTSSEAMQAKGGIEHRWWNAAIPVLTVVLVVFFGLYGSGRASVGGDASLMDVFGAADPFVTLLWGSLAGCLVAFGLTLAQRIMSVQECIDAIVSGMRAMLIAMVILTLAWSLGSVTEVVGTASFLTQLVNDRIAVELLPAIVFLTSAAIAFATGTSWGTMAILLPLVIPLLVSLGAGPAAESAIFLGATGSVLAGAIFGDHCSPISDTTVLSSTASACDHVDHVRTQLPYALLVGTVGVVVGNVGTAYGLPSWIALLVSGAILWAFLRFRGVVVEAQIG